MSLCSILNNMDSSTLSFILHVVGWIIFFLIIKGYLFSYYSKKGENLATKEDVKEITKIVEDVKTKFTNKIEEFKRDLRVEERFKIERLLSERNAILDFGSELLTFIHYLTVYDNHEFKSEIEYVKARYKQIKMTSYKSRIDLSKLELIINDTELLDAFQGLFISVRKTLIKHNFNMLNDMVELHGEWNQKQIDSMDESNEWEERRTKLLKNFTIQLKENLKMLDPKIKNLKAITIMKLKEYAHIDNT